MVLSTFPNMQRHNFHHHIPIITISFPVTIMPSPNKKANKADAAPSPMGDSLSTSNDTSNTPQSNLLLPRMSSLAGAAAAAKQTLMNIENQPSLPHLVLLCYIGIPDNTNIPSYVLTIPDPPNFNHTYKQLYPRTVPNAFQEQGLFLGNSSA
jgi:hypothetical protein